MAVTALTQLLDDVRDGRVSPDDAVTRIQHLPFTDLGFARVDHHRALRQGRAETVFGPGKTPDQCAAIVADLLAHDATSPLILTRATEDPWPAQFERNPGDMKERLMTPFKKGQVAKIVFHQTADKDLVVGRSRNDAGTAEV